MKKEISLLNRSFGVIAFLCVPLFAILCLIVDILILIFNFIEHLRYFYGVWLEYWKSKKPWGIFDE